MFDDIIDYDEIFSVVMLVTLLTIFVRLGQHYKRTDFGGNVTELKKLVWFKKITLFPTRFVSLLKITRSVNL